MARVQNDVTVLQNFLSQGLISTIGNTFSVVGILVVMFVINWRLAALTSTAIPVFVTALVIWQGFARRSFRRARATISVVNASLQENVSGVRVIQSMGREERQLAALRRGQRGEPRGEPRRRPRRRRRAADRRADVGDVADARAVLRRAHGDERRPDDRRSSSPSRSTSTASSTRSARSRSSTTSSSARRSRPSASSRSSTRSRTWSMRRTPTSCRASRAP